MSAEVDDRRARGSLETICEPLPYFGSVWGAEEIGKHTQRARARKTTRYNARCNETYPDAAAWANGNPTVSPVRGNATPRAYSLTRLQNHAITACARF